MSLDGAIQFETEQLVCRRWLPSDQKAVYDVYSDASVARWIGDGSLITEEESRSWLAVTSSNYLKRGYGMFALEDKLDRTVAGFVGLVHPGGQLEAEIKYAFRRSHWGKGLASEVVRATVAYGAATHGLTKIVATVAPENGASQRVLEKAGFAFVKERVDEHGAREFYYEWHVANERS
ncbi:MAG: GNAT family N-acetyltransferase [Pseudomonadota bacterium]